MQNDNNIAKTSLISIIMSVYKEPIAWIEMSIKSVLSQSYSYFEFIIVDDNPDDNALAEFLSMNERNDNRIKIIFNDMNIGLTRSLNKACLQMHGNFMARIDADDIWIEGKLQTQMDFMMSHPNIDVCGTWIELIDENEKKIGSNAYPTQHIDIAKQMMYSNPIVHSSVVIRSSALNNRLSKIYNEDCLTSQDYELWTSLFLEGSIFANIPQYLTLYRYSSQQVSKLKKKNQKDNAAKISNEFVRKLFNKIQIKDYSNLSCDDLSHMLKNAHMDKTSEPLYYHFLWVKYTNSYKSVLSLFNSMIRNGDLCNIPIKSILKLIIGRK